MLNVLGRLLDNGALLAVTGGVRVRVSVGVVTELLLSVGMTMDLNLA